MSVCVAILSCDRYEPYWRGLWNFMGKHWDRSIEAPVRLFNETREAKTPPWCSQTLTGEATFTGNLRRAVELIDEDHVFLMLEDFWPIAPMTKAMFDSLYEEFVGSEVDALQVSNYTPYYTVTGSGREVMGQEVLDFLPGSEWIFNFQARFWRKEALLGFLAEPRVPESAVSSAITVEMASDEAARRAGGLRASLFHYLWYPLSGVAYRGEPTDFGRHLQNIVEIDDHVEKMFSQRGALSSRQGCSA